MRLVVQLVGSEFSRKFQQGCRSSECIVAICLYFLSTSPKFVLVNMNQTIFNSSGRFKYNFGELGMFWVFPENQSFHLFSSYQVIAPAWHLSPPGGSLCANMNVICSLLLPHSKKIFLFLPWLVYVLYIQVRLLCCPHLKDWIPIFDLRVGGK